MRFRQAALSYLQCPIPPLLTLSIPSFLFQRFPPIGTTCYVASQPCAPFQPALSIERIFTESRAESIETREAQEDPAIAVPGYQTAAFLSVLAVL